MIQEILFRWLPQAIISIACVVLSGCAAVDGALPSRVATLNRGADDTRNESILLNIVRASREQPLTFVALSKVTDNGSVSGNIGFPTFTFGPNQTPAQRYLGFGPNSLNTMISSSFDLGIVETSKFYRSIMRPVDISVIDLLISQGFSRELVYYILLSSARVEFKNDRIEEYTNDISLDDPLVCPNFDYSATEVSECRDPNHPSYDPKRCQSPYNPAAPSGYGIVNQCGFHRFQFLIETGLKYGLSTESRAAVTTEKKDDKGGAASETSPSTESRLCFDPALTRSGRNSNMLRAREKFSGICDGPWSKNTKVKDAKQLEFFPFEYSTDTRTTVTSNIKITFKTRSTYAIIKYLGSLLALGGNGVGRLNNGYPLLEIQRGRISNCFVQTVDEEVYCVPSEGALNTKRIFALISQLLALSTDPADLPFTRNVQVIP